MPRMKDKPDSFTCSENVTGTFVILWYARTKSKLMNYITVRTV